MEITLEGIKPLNNRILIKKDPVYDAEESVTSSGIVIIDRNKPKDRYAMATIIKLGKGMKTPNGKYIKFSDFWKEGDKVLYYVPAQGTELMIEGESYYLIRGEDILQVLVD